MNKKALVSLLFIVCSGVMNAQLQVNMNKPEPNEISTFVFHTKLTDHLKFRKPSITFGVECNFTKTIALNVEGGYIYDNNSNDIGIGVSGYKYGVEPRIYISRKTDSSNSNPFISFYWGHDESTSLRIVNVQRFNGAFTQKMDIIRTEKNNVGYLSVGFSHYTGKKLKTTVAMGIGSRITRLSNNLPEDAELVPDGRFFFANNNRLISGFRSIPSLRLSVYLTWSGKP